MIKRICCLTIVIMMLGTMSFSYGGEVETTVDEITEPTEPPSTMESSVKPTKETDEVETTTPITETKKEEPKLPTEIERVKKVSGLKSKKIKTKSFVLSWNKLHNAQAYEVYKYSILKKRYIKIKTTSSTNVKITKLTPNTKSYYKVRAYTIKNGKKTFGKFSKVKITKTKINKKQLRQKLIKKGKSKVGCAYVRGGDGPSKFDCSGFVYWTYKNASVPVKKKIKRTNAHDMYGQLSKYKISSKLSKAKKGDIIFYKNGSKYTHVAISIGNGKIIHAANPKKGVCVAKASACRSSSVAIVRIIK